MGLDFLAPVYLLCVAKCGLISQLFARGAMVALQILTLAVEVRVLAGEAFPT